MSSWHVAIDHWRAGIHDINWDPNRFICTHFTTPITVIETGRVSRYAITIITLAAMMIIIHGSLGAWCSLA